MSNFPRSVMIKDVDAKWAKLSGDTAPTNTFGGVQWELTILTTDAAKAQEIRDAGLKVKEGQEDGMTTYATSLKRKGLKSTGNSNADGTPIMQPNTPVKIVDVNVQPLSSAIKIGNGSKVNVNLWQYEYEFAGKKGVATSLTGVQVVELIEFKPSGGFEVISAPSTAAAPASNEEPSGLAF